ncbi:MFS transporter [Saccharothrix australiensis]|uniref:Sugar phosphate permease n=1 Tax=Saccharothrix australiensis TaxID=2072 RepID=A0A495VXB7_9PSEU|nr:MFS transporter [Saccharothrix australiensis]RKT53899.1 sugar phosphate permease [Saccharothrix australiensis]
MPSTGKAFAVLATAQFLVVLNTSIVNVALPSIRAGLGLTDTGLSWVVNGYGLAFGALLLLGGQLTDALGARRVLVAGLAAFAVGSLAAGLAWTAPVLVTARAVQGVGAALLAPAALALVLRHHPTRLGAWGAVSGVGGAAGALLGGLLAGTLGWQAIFLITVPVATAALAAARALVPRDTPTGGRLDVTGALLVTGGLVALTAGLTASAPVPPLVAGAILLAAFVVRRRGQPLLRTLGATARANAAMAVLGAVWVGLFYFLPLYQQQVLGYPPLVAGLAQLPLAGATALGSALAPRLPRAALPIALAALAAGTAWFATGPVFPFDVLGPPVLAGAGLGVAFVHLTVDATRVPATDAGVAGGLVNTSRQVGGAIGLAALVASTTGFAAAFTATAALAAVAAVLTIEGAAR